MRNSTIEEELLHSIEMNNPYYSLKSSATIFFLYCIFIQKIIHIVTSLAWLYSIKTACVLCSTIPTSVGTSTLCRVFLCG